MTQTTHQRPKVSAMFPEQGDDVARSLGRAFIHDPPLLRVLPDVTDPVERAERLTRMFAVVLDMQRRAGHPTLCVVQDGRAVGGALIEGVRRGLPIGARVAALADGGRMFAALGASGLVRAARLQGELHENRPDKPHLYLNLLGIDPEFQRHHFGSALLDELRAIAEGRPEMIGVYLETATEANVAYYQSRGYVVLSEIHPLGVKMWRMLQLRR
ncbi:MAG: GNAT family N-acetyltransferase [Candidatus Binataceae bacterium]